MKGRDRLISNRNDKLNLPCLRGQMGDWMYYLTVLPFDEVAKRVSMPSEINKKYNDENLKLDEWIQRKIDDKRLTPIVEYLKSNKQRFFNSLVLGIYGGEPTWQELELNPSNIYSEKPEETLDYLSKTFGLLTLSGNESIFAIDGQHRAMGIRKALNEEVTFDKDEVSVILLAHKTDKEGKIRTRRLFSTLNRYAKPVNQSEIIALSEDDNCAILTRRLVEKHRYLKDKILVNKSRSVSPKNKTSFTSIIVLYDLIEKILTDKSVPGYPLELSGKKRKDYLNTRIKDKELDNDFKNISNLFNELIKKIPSLNSFFVLNKEIIRENPKTSLLFRPIGQNILFDILKVGIQEKKKNIVIDYFKNDDFNLSNKIWKRIFWDEETNDIVTTKTRQRYATILILEKLGFRVKRTKKDREIYDNFNINANDI